MIDLSGSSRSSPLVSGIEDDLVCSNHELRDIYTITVTLAQQALFLGITVWAIMLQPVNTDMSLGFIYSSIRYLPRSLDFHLKVIVKL